MFHENCSVTLSNLSQNGYDLRVLCSIKYFSFPIKFVQSQRDFGLSLLCSIKFIQFLYQIKIMA